MRKPGKMVRQALFSVVRKPATVLYPFERLVPPPNMRGKIVGDANKCIGCKLCMRDCPSDAIHIIKTGEKQFDIEFDLDRCIYCGQCVDSCNKDALALSAEFELAQLDPKKFKITYRNAGSPGTP
jgi:formate hydrogenlyase subunit 6/NADH:ubiquinone oxidoreductase subunit I